MRAGAFGGFCLGSGESCSLPSVESSCNWASRDSGDDNRSRLDIVALRISPEGTPSSGEECLVYGVSSGVAQTSKSECSFGGLGRTSSLWLTPDSASSKRFWLGSTGWFCLKVGLGRLKGGVGPSSGLDAASQFESEDESRGCSGGCVSRCQ